MHWSRAFSAAMVGAAILVASGCAPTVEDDEWMLEPVSWDSQSVGDVDVAFGMSTLAADGAGGFWAGSAGSWLHVGADGETLARFNIDAEHPLHRIGAVAGLSPTELVVVRTVNEPDAVPGLSIVDMETLEFTDVPVKLLPETDPRFGGIEFGDFRFGSLVIHDADAYVVRYQPVFPALLDFEVLRVDLDSGDREVLHREAFAPGDESSETTPEMPHVDMDVDAAGRIYLATPSYRIVLDADGSEVSRAAQTATRPAVAVRPDGLALWWGGADEGASAASVLVGGSGEARRLIDRRETCDELYREDALHMTLDGDDEPLPFLCSPNDAAWTGDSWIVATGGEGDGVLVELTPPAALG